MFGDVVTFIHHHHSSQHGLSRDVRWEGVGIGVRLVTETFKIGAMYHK